MNKVSRIIAIVVLVVLLLAVGTLAAGAMAKANLAKKYPAPGQLVDVGGHKMHIHCTGQGSPTVILEAGLAEFSVSWAKVQPEVAGLTHVCSYDRAGYGWSGPSPHPRTARSTVDELHTLLAKANVQGPYVLVGHSLGGLFMRVYAHSYPDEVAALVLVDSSHEEQNRRRALSYPNDEDRKSADEQARKQFHNLSLLKSTGLMALLTKSIPDPGLPDDALGQYRAMLATTGFFETALAELNAFDGILAEASALRVASLGDKPLIVLSQGRWEDNPSLSEAENQQFREVWQALQSELVALSSVGEQVIAEQSGHNIQIDQPDLVIDAVRRILGASRD